MLAVVRDVRLGHGQSWTIHVDVDGCAREVLIGARSAALGPIGWTGNEFFRLWHWTDIGAAEADAGEALVRALARAPLAPPNVVMEPPLVTDPRLRRHGIRMTSLCDRACIFCEKNYQRVADPSAPPWTAERRTADARAADRARAEAEWCELQRALPKLWGDGVRSLSWSDADICESPYFDDALRLAHEIGFREMAVQSPGTRLADIEFQRFLKANCVRRLTVTWHAPSAELFARIGGHPEGLELIETVVRNAAALGLEVYVNVPLISLNAHVVPELVAALLSRRFRGLTIFFWHPVDRVAEAYDALPLSFEAAKYVWHGIAEVGGASTRIEISGVPACAVPPELAHTFRWDVEGRHLGGNRLGFHEACDGCLARTRCAGAPMGYWRRHAPKPITEAKDVRLPLVTPKGRPR